MSERIPEIKRQEVTVNKIGGVNIAQLDVVKSLVERLDARHEKIVLIVSAFEGVTGKLIAAMDKLNVTDYSVQDIDAAFEPVREIHENMISRFFRGEHAQRARERYDSYFTILRNAMMTHKRTSNVLMPVVGSFEIRDQIIGFGERMAGAFAEIYFEQEGKSAHYFNDVTVDQNVLKEGPVTDRSLHEAKKRGVIHALRACEDTREDIIRILGGHIGGTPKGLVVHQGRGYSDITAVDVALALRDMGEKVSTILWKDVDGVYTANPKDLDGENKPVLVRDISTSEALENASAGSGLVNVRALSLAGRHGLDLNIRNIRGSDLDFGTNVVTGSVDTQYLFKTIVSNQHVDAITVVLPEMADQPGFAAAILDRFREHEVNIDQIGTEGTSMTFAIPLPPDRADQEEYRTRIRRVMRDLQTIKVKGEQFTSSEIAWDKTRFASVSVIGSELRDRRGILGTIATMFGCFDINIYTISHGTQQTRVTFLIDRKDRKRAVQLLHSVFVDNDETIKSEFARRRAELEAEITRTFDGQ